MQQTRTTPLFFKRTMVNQKKNGEYVFKIHLRIVKKSILYNRKK